MCKKENQTIVLNSVYPPSWDQHGRARHVVSVVTSTVTKVTTSCLVLDWWRQLLRLSASLGGSMETVNPRTNMRSIHVPRTPKEVSSLICARQSSVSQLQQVQNATARICLDRHLPSLAARYIFD